MTGLVRRLWWLFFVLVGGCRSPVGIDDPGAAEPVPDAAVVAVLRPEGPPPPIDARAVASLPPAVARVGPEGVVGTRAATVFVRFTQPMRQHETGPGAPRFTLEPPVRGTMTWTSPYSVQFDPEEDLPAATAVTATIRGSLETAGGEAVPLDVSTRFETSRPVFHIDPLDWASAETLPWNARFAITTWSESLPMTPARFSEHVHATARPAHGNGKGVRIPVIVRHGTTAEHEPASRAGDRMLVVQPRDHWPPDREIEVTVDKDLPVGSLTLGRSVSTTFVTEPGLQAEIKCGVEYDDGCDASPLFIGFSNPVSRDQFAKIEVTPRPRGFKVDYAYGEGLGDRIKIGGRFAMGAEYRVTLDADLRDIHGQPLHRAITRTIRTVQPPPLVRLVGSHGTLPATGRRTIGLEARWVERVQIRAAVLTDAQLLEQFACDTESLRIPAKPRHLHQVIVDLDVDPKMGWSSHEIDLAAVTAGDRRPVLVEVKPLRVMASAKHRPAPATQRAIYQQTDLGVLSLISPAKAVSRVSSLDREMPVAGVSADLYRATQTIAAPHLKSLGATGPDGIVAVPRSTALPKRGLILFHTADDRFAARVGELNARQRDGVDGFDVESAYEDPESLLSTLVTERPLYRAGDPVHVVGWSAWVTNRDHVGLRPPPAKTEVHMTLVDRDGIVVSEAKTRTDAGGKYWSTLSVPEHARLGNYRVRAKIGDHGFSRGVRVKDFRTPTFKLITSADRGDVTDAGDVVVSLAASYYYGGAVPIQQLSRKLDCYRGGFVPPGYRDAWTIGGVSGDVDVGDHVGLPRAEVAVDSADAARGRATVRVPTSMVPRVAPYRCTLSLGVRDTSMMSVGAETSWQTHPDAYLALGAPPGDLRAGEALSIPVRAVDFSGARRAHPVRVEVEHLVWAKRADANGWEERTMRTHRCSLSTTVIGADAVCTTPKVRAGHYVITAERDDGPRPRAAARVEIWVGSKQPPPAPPGPSELRLSVTPDSPSPGDRVKVRIRAPAAATGTGTLALMHGGLRHVEPFTMRSGRAEVELVADQSWVPQMEIEALLPRPKASNSWERLASERVTVTVGDPLRALAVDVEAPAQARPNEAVKIRLQVRDAKGDPTAASVSVWAVDEAILSLEEPIIPDLVGQFIVQRPARTSLEHEFDAILAPYRKRRDPYFGRTSGVPGGQGIGILGGRASGGGTGEGISATAVRERFETTPVFIGNVDLPASGRGWVSGTLPENLTTFRVTAIASATVEGSKAVARFGHGEDRVRLTMPLIVRAVAPQVMRPGDRAMVAAVVDNLGGPAGTVMVRMMVHKRDPSAGGPLEARGVLAKSVAIAAGGQARVSFEVTANAVGEAGITMEATLRPDDGSATLTDAMKVPLLVKRERTLVRRAASYGSIIDDTPIAVGLALPSDRVDGSGVVGVTVATSILDGLQDIVQDLVQYPYGCVEQTSSGLVPLIALQGLVERYPLGIEDVDAYVASGIARLQSMQTEGGGFGYWPGAKVPHAYGTAYALWVLERAAAAGIAVPSGLRERARVYLGESLARWAQGEASSPHDDVRAAMAVHALSVSSGAPAQAVDKLVAQASNLPVFARALLLMSLWEVDHSDPRVSAQLAAVLASVRVSGGTATVAEEGAIFPQYFDSGPRTAAIVLLALSTVAPDHAVIEPLARGLMALRAAGRFRNTQERAYVLLALSAYAAGREGEVPRLAADAWIGGHHALSRRVEGERFASAQAQDSMAALEAAAAPKVTLRREGGGRLYYRVGMEWTPHEEQRRSVAAGLAVDTVLRRAEGVVSDGVQLPPGTLLALDVTVVANAAVDYVAVDIPLPGGLEAIDRTIGEGRKAMVLSGSRGSWANHEEVRRDRALLFADRLAAGSHTHTVYLRATTPGTFDMPPTVAQSMYVPEISGHTARRTIQVGHVP